MNQFTMTDKNKRLEKVLKKKGLTKWLKPASNSLEKCQLVLVEDKRCAVKSFLLRKDE